MIREIEYAFGWVAGFQQRPTAKGPVNMKAGRQGVVFAEAGGRCQSLSMTGRTTEGRI